MLNAHFVNYTRDKQDLPAETRSTAVRVRTLNTNMKALQQKISQYGFKLNGRREQSRDYFECFLVCCSRCIENIRYKSTNNAQCSTF